MEVKFRTSFRPKGEFQNFQCGKEVDDWMWWTETNSHYHTEKKIAFKDASLKKTWVSCGKRKINTSSACIENKLDTVGKKMEHAKKIYIEYLLRSNPPHSVWAQRWKKKHSMKRK